MMKPFHSPVLLKESIDYLFMNKSGNYFEGTTGFGGHTDEILKRLNNIGSVISTDVDLNAFNYCRKKFQNEKRVNLYNFNFSLVDVIAKIESLEFFDGIIADLGVSSFQLDNAEAGFSYSSETKLDLRFDRNVKFSAADVINKEPEKKLSEIFFELGEEKNSRKIARVITEARSRQKIVSTEELKEIISSVTNPGYLTKTLSRIFQALRIYVNDELGILKQFLENSMKVLRIGGRIVMISYHSLEDRIVKEFFKYENLSCVCPKDAPVCTCGKEQRLKIITRKPVVPSDEEIRINRRARSAKLRVAERI